MGMMAGILTLALVLTGCSSSGKWAAKVNEEEITVDTLNTYVKDAQDLYTKQGMDFTSENGKSSLAQLRAQILQRLIESKLIAQEIKKEGLSADTDEVKAQQEKIMSQFDNNEDSLLQMLKQQGMDKQALENFLVLYTHVTKDITVSDDDVKAYFEKNKSNYDQAEQVKASHILLKTEEEAKEVIAELDKGANFTELAKTKSTEEGASETGGELGYFKKGDMVQEFEDAAFAQAVGTYSKTPVKTQFGYHVILVEDHKQAVEANFDNVKNTVKADALMEAQDAKYSEYMQNLMSAAKIEYGNGYAPAG